MLKTLYIQTNIVRWKLNSIERIFGLGFLCICRGNFDIYIFAIKPLVFN